VGDSGADESLKQQQWSESPQQQQQQLSKEEMTLRKTTSEAMHAAAAAMLKVLARRAIKSGDLQTAGADGEQQLEYTCRALAALIDSGLDFDRLIWHASLRVRAAAVRLQQWVLLLLSLPPQQSYSWQVAYARILKGVADA
jgi:hypothetical protein